MARYTEYLKPKGAIWYGLEFDVDFDCENGPAVIEGSENPLGIESFGFVFSHTYILRSLYIDNVRQDVYSTDTCESMTVYTYDLHYSLGDKIGIGFNLGIGTGTFGNTFRSKPHTITMQTPPICCDQPSIHALGRTKFGMDGTRSIMHNINQSASALALMTGLVLSVIGFASVTPYAEVSSWIWSAIGSLTGLAIAVTASRHLAFALSRDAPSSQGPQEQIDRIEQ